MAKLNMDNMPDEEGAPVSEGRHTLKIEEATIRTSSNDSQMLTLDLKAKEGNFREFIPIFDANENPIQFGQVKLKKILEAVDVHPEGDFTLQMAAELLEGGKFSAEVVEDEYQGRKQSKLAHPSSYQAIKKQKKQTKKQTPKVDPEVEAELEDDDDEL